MNPSEITAALRLRDKKHFREHDQQSAVTAGLMEMTLPEKPNSRFQEYSLTVRGSLDSGADTSRAQFDWDDASL